MAIENSNTVVKSKAGTPNYRKLHEEGRMPVPLRDDGSAFDPNPSPKKEIKIPIAGKKDEYIVKKVSSGYARGADNIWRVNYSAEQHLENMYKAEANREMGKDTSFVPELHPEELEDFVKYLDGQGLRISKGQLVQFEKEVKKEVKKTTEKKEPVAADLSKPLN